MCNEVDSLVKKGSGSQVKECELLKRKNITYHDNNVVLIKRKNEMSISNKDNIANDWPTCVYIPNDWSKQIGFQQTLKEHVIERNKPWREATNQQHQRSEYSLPG